MDFIWVNRDYQAFEWFIELLGELELQQLTQLNNERFIDIHLYMTSSKERREIKLDAEQMIDFNGNKLDKNHNSVKDFYLPLNPGRPNLDKV